MTVLGALVTVTLVMLLAGWRIGRAGSSATMAPSAAGIRLEAQPGVPRAEIVPIRTLLAADRELIGHDFRITDLPLLLVRLYANQRSFALELHRLEGIWPQGAQDRYGNVVHGELPLGPPNTFLSRNLAHIYTEWVLDRLTGNLGDRQPTPAWLYDGIAEWEADRRATALPCHVPPPYPLPLSQLRSPQQWSRVRSTPYGSLEYCEARDAAGHLIDHVGWAAMVRLLHQQHSWSAFALLLGA